MSSPSEYLSPIGGIAVPSHRVSAIVIAAVGYGPLLLLASHGLQRRGTRTPVNLGVIVFTVERIILLSLHAVASTDVKWRTSLALVKYTEISLSLAYIAIANDAISLLRCAQGKPSDSQNISSCLADVKEARKGLVVAAALGIIAGGFYRFNLEWPGAAARLILALRCSSAGAALLFITTIALAAGWSLKKQPHIPRRALCTVLSIAILTGAVAVYRLVVSSSTYLGFLLLGPSSTRKSPAIVPSAAMGAPFLVFHILLEWMSIAILLGAHLGEDTEPGSWSDYRQAPSSDARV